MSLYAHAQIEYERNGEFVESLTGLNPTDDVDRLLLHAMLDEFLDEYLIPEFRLGGEGSSMCHFTVRGDIHDDSNLAF